MCFDIPAPPGPPLSARGSRQARRLDDIEIVQKTNPHDPRKDVQPSIETDWVERDTASRPRGNSDADDDRKHHTRRDGAFNEVLSGCIRFSPLVAVVFRPGHPTGTLITRPVPS